jgi:hypothetical protein
MPPQYHQAVVVTVRTSVQCSSVSLQIGNDHNDSNIIACGISAAELLAVSRFKIMLRGNKNIRTRIEPQILGSPLNDKMIRDYKH